MEGMSSLEPLELSVLNTLLVARPGEEITKKISDWEPVAHPVPDTTLDGRLMEGTTYLEHSALEVSLDSGLMEGMSSLEPLEQLVLNTLSTAQPEEGITEELSDWEPVALLVPDITLDGRHMEGTTYLEHSVLGVSLDSGLMAGMSHLEPFEQSVLGTWLVAQPVEVLTETDMPERSALASQVDYGHSKLELSARPILDINQDGNTEMDTDPSERSALATHVDFGLLHVESLSRPNVNVALDRRPMEGITAPLPIESSGLALAQDRGHMEYSARSRPLGHAVLFHADPAGQHAAVGTLSPSDCCPAGPAGPCVAGGSVGPDDCLQVMEPFEHSVPDHADPATVGPLEHSVLDMEMRNDNLDSSNELQFGSDLGQFSLGLEDAIRREVLKSRSMGRVSACDVNDLLLSPENACLGDKEMSLDEVRLEGLRQWNMDMDVEYQYETSNGLPVYHSGDMYDSEDSEEYDPLEMACSAYVEDYNFDVPEGM